MCYLNFAFFFNYSILINRCWQLLQKKMNSDDEIFSENGCSNCLRLERKCYFSMQSELKQKMLRFCSKDCAEEYIIRLESENFVNSADKETQIENVEQNLDDEEPIIEIVKHTIKIKIPLKRKLSKEEQETIDQQKDKKKKDNDDNNDDEKDIDQEKDIDEEQIEKEKIVQTPIKPMILSTLLGSGSFGETYAGFYKEDFAKYSFSDKYFANRGYRLSIQLILSNAILT